MAATINQTNETITNVLEAYNDKELANLQLFAGYPKPVLQFAAVCCILFMIIGIPGNLVTIFALARYKKIRNATAIFIINLSISDCLYCCFNLPLVASSFANQMWPYGAIICKIIAAARYCLVGISIFTVMGITICRFILISYPKIYPRLYKTRSTIVSIICIWIICWGALIPTWLQKWGRFDLNLESSLCEITADHLGNSPKNTFVLCGFIIPGLTIILGYARIYWIVRKTSKKSKNKLNLNNQKSITDDFTENSTVVDRLRESDVEPNPCTSLDMSPRLQTIGPILINTNKKQNFKSSFASISRDIRQKIHITKSLQPTSKDKRLLSMISAIMVSFFLCYLPVTIIKVSTDGLKLSPGVCILSYILRYLAPCINPIIYAVMSQEYRKAYKKAIQMPSFLTSCRFLT